MGTSDLPSPGVPLPPADGVDFRRTRWSNDFAGWFLAVVSTVMFTGFVAGMVTDAFDEPVPACFAFVVGLFLALTALFGVRLVLFPLESELVVEAGSVRWGPSGRPNRQDRLRLADVRRWVIHRFDRELFADTGCVVLKPVGPFILSLDDIDALLAYLVERHANVCVVDGDKVARERGV